jgi:hypothetical protein
VAMIGFDISANAGYEYENHNNNINLDVNDSNEGAVKNLKELV